MWHSYKDKVCISVVSPHLASSGLVFQVVCRANLGADIFNIKGWSCCWAATGSGGGSRCGGSGAGSRGTGYRRLPLWHCADAVNARGRFSGTGAGCGTTGNGGWSGSCRFGLSGVYGGEQIKGG